MNETRREIDADVAARIAAVDWNAVATALDADGCAVVPKLLTARACAALAALFDDLAPFRGEVVMARHHFGSGVYKYFAYPLPDLVETLRSALYAPLARVANAWSSAADGTAPYPQALPDWLARCHAHGQARPTPLLLRYGPGDYNCLHQDRYGERQFPLQATILLSAPGRDFRGGEFVLTEQRPRRQSRVEVVPLGRGDAVVFAVDRRPVAGARGYHGVTHRHGVSRVRAGRRDALGILFHDAP